MKKPTRTVCLLIITFSCILIFGCSRSVRKEDTVENIQNIQSAEPETPQSDHTPSVFLPSADGIVTYGDASVDIDASHSSEGYIMIRYSGFADDIKIQIIGPDQNVYPYFLSDSGDFEAFPLVCGSGTYQIQVLKQTEKDTYDPVFTQSLDAAMNESYIPFLYPNQYVDYTATSKAILKGSELAANTASDLEVLQNVYQYITENMTCDIVKAADLSYRYLPDIDETFESGTGNCFDLAAVMTAILRSQKIPAKLEVSYTDETLHARISANLRETGGAEHIICFDGTTWKLQEPAALENTEDNTEMKMTFTY